MMWKLVQPSKAVIYGLIALALCALIALGFWRGMAAIEAMVEAARHRMRVERDLHWAGQIQKSNAEVAVKQAAQAVQAAA